MAVLLQWPSGRGTSLPNWRQGSDSPLELCSPQSAGAIGSVPRSDRGGSRFESGALYSCRFTYQRAAYLTLQVQEAPMQVFGTHDEKTLAQLAQVAERARKVALMADGHLG